MKRPTRLKKCAERFTDSCDPTETDGCCSIIPCGYCLLLERYGEDDLIGEATFDGSQWYGTVGGNVFQAYWESVSGQCEFVVLFNAEEVSREPCYGAVSCKDASGSAGVTIGYDDWTLTWTKQENRPLPHVTEDGCVRHFCGSCNCTCKQLRVMLSGRDAGGLFFGVEVLSEYTSDDCAGPTWTGTIDGKSVEISLEADTYGDCILAGSVDGVEFDPVSIDDCNAIDVTIGLYGGGILQISCAPCGDDEIDRDDPCDSDTDRPLYVTGDYTATVGSTFTSGPSGLERHWVIELEGVPCTYNFDVHCIDGVITADLGCQPPASTRTVTIISNDPILITMDCVPPVGHPFGCLPRSIVISE